MKIVKKQLLDYLLQKGYSGKIANNILMETFSFIENELAKGNEIEFRRFATFKPCVVDAHKGFNFWTKEVLSVKPKLNVRVKISTSILKRINNVHSR